MSAAHRLLCLALLGAAACSKTAAPPPTPPAVTCTDAAPCALEPSGAAKDGLIAAAGQVDVYSLEVAAARASVRTILNVRVEDAAPVTPVKLVFLLVAPDGKSVLASRGPARTTGPQSLLGSFLLPGAGSYRVIVRDVLSAASDSHNGYTVQAALIDDPDAAFEPDDALPAARPIGFSAATATASGSVAFAGDRDLLTFAVAVPGSIARLAVSQAAVAKSPLRLRVSLLQLSTATPADLSTASSRIELTATAAGAGLTAERTRFLGPGSYAIVAADAAGEGADAAAEARWTVSLQQLADPDPLEQTSRNDDAATATLLVPGASALEGAIGSQGDRDWYRIELPATSTSKVLEVKLDPQQANTDLELNWLVAEPYATPSDACDSVERPCGSVLLCAQGLCAFDRHAQHHFTRGEVTPSTVRIPHLGPARAVYVVVNDQGDARFSALRYKVSARLVDDPDLNETAARNDQLDAGTPIDAGVQAGTGKVTYSTTGQISTWDYIDTRTTAEQRADLDWYAMALPPRAFGPPDGGCADGGFGGTAPDSGVDGGCPDGPQPRSAYGMTLRWHGPTDGTYRLGLQGVVPTPDGGLACRFSLDQQIAHLDDAGTYSVGDQPADPCFCLPAANAEGDKLWLRVEAAHRPAPPQANASSDQPYAVKLELTPGVLGASCDGGCAPLLQPKPCPGN